MQALEVRLTHTYVGTYSDLDKWLYIGTFDEIGRKVVPVEDEDDICDPHCVDIYGVVKFDPRIHDKWLDVDNAKDYDFNFDKWLDDMRTKALHDSFTRVGCAHEYDCCGCRSHHVTDVERETGDLFRVRVYSSRNY